MTSLFSQDYWMLWAAALGLALFVPVRNLIWVLYVRRGEAKSGERLDDAERGRLKRRASVTGGLICLLFAVFYMQWLFRETP